MACLADGLIRYGFSPLICAWNLDAADRSLSTEMAQDYQIPLEWLDVREPDVAAKIPPLEG